MSNRLLLRIVTVAAVAAAGVHLYAAFAPGASNWSVHHLAFLPSPFRWVIAGLMLVVLIPRVQLSIFRGLDLLHRRGEALAPAVRRIALVLLAGGLVLVLWAGRERAYFLGDGFLVLRNLGQVHSATTISQMSFRDAPLTAIALREVSELLGAIGRTDGDELAFRIVSIACGLAWIGIAFWLARLLTKKQVDRALVVFFLIGWGGVQLFFGYVEIYSPASCLLLLFLAASIAHLRGESRFVFPSLVFGALLAAHFGMGFVLPAYVWLCYVNVRNGRYGSMLLGCMLAVIVFVVSLAFAEYTPSQFVELLTSGGTHSVPLLHTDASREAYTLFSAAHFAEIANILVLASPLAPLLALCLVVGFAGHIRCNNNEWIFIIIAVISCLGFVVIMNPDLGMSRDWDVFTLFTIPLLVFAAAASFWLVPSEQERRRILLVAASAGILHVIPWIALNANEAEAVERFSSLSDPGLWGRTAVLNSYDELSAYYRKNDNLARSREYYRKYIAVDSSNGRILGNCGSISQDLGDDSAAIRYYEMAVRHNTIVNSVYNDLAKFYAKQNRYDEAIDMEQKGLARGFISAEALNNLGVMIIKKTDKYQDPLWYFQKALEVDSMYDQAYLNAGISCSYLHRDQEMIAYLTKFLELQPNYPEAGKLIQAMEAAKKRSLAVPSD